MARVNLCVRGGECAESLSRKLKWAETQGRLKMGEKGIGFGFTQKGEKEDERIKDGSLQLIELSIMMYQHLLLMDSKLNLL